MNNSFLWWTVLRILGWFASLAITYWTAVSAYSTLLQAVATKKDVLIYIANVWGGVGGGRVEIKLHREPLIETFSHTEANWTLRWDKYIINFFFFFCWMERCPLVNHIYEKVWLQLEIFHEGKFIGNRTSFPKMQITGLICHSWCSLWLHASSLQERPEALASLYLRSEEDRTDCFSNTS